jgi:hypothetical protein
LARQIERYEADAADATLPKRDRDEAARKASEVSRQLETLNLGIPFTEFARAVGEDPRVAEILDREQGEKHNHWRQVQWKDNRKSVATQTEALIAQELDNPIRTAVSTEASGILELVYPGLATLSLPPSFAGNLPNDEVRAKLAPVWPDCLAALLAII